MTASVLALILARGGSKSIPRKNILEVAGKPLIAHTIAHGLASKYVNRVIVSTDDEPIAAVARSFGAETPFLRPSKISQDGSTDFEAFHHCLTWIRENQPEMMPDLVVQLRATNPVRNVERIDEAIAIMLANPQVDGLKSVSRPSESPFKMWVEAGNGLVRPAMQLDDVAEPHCLPRQALPQVWWQNGYVDIVRPRVILDKGMMYGDTVVPFVVNEKIHELDYPEDLPAIETALRTSSGAVSAESITHRHSV